MKKELNPLVVIGVIVAAVVLLGLFAFRALAPHPPEATIPPPDQMNEGEMKRRNIMKQGQSSGTDAGASQPASSKSTGE